MEFKSTEAFIKEDFLLQNKTAERLYFDYAASMPIIDYHNHLPPDVIAANQPFKGINEIWLDGDHYKWRAMRTLGIPEKFITGKETSNKEKFDQWAYTVPFTAGNPLFHWTHLELQRYFGINTLLQPSTSTAIFEETNRQLLDLTPKVLLNDMKVEMLCTTDDPIDDLSAHQKIAASDERGPEVLPGFRPDNIFGIEGEQYLDYLKTLGSLAETKIEDLDSLLAALNSRIDYFHQNGCRISDHGLEFTHASDFTHAQANAILKKRLSGSLPSTEEASLFNSCVLYELFVMYNDHGWTQQLHLGALRGNNQKLKRQLGADVGCDSIGDFDQAKNLSKLLGMLNDKDKLTNTILYNLNPAMNEVFATMPGNFNNEKVEIQWGTAWWFLDQKDGMELQMRTLSNMGLLSKFIGMLTDSRSFLSFPRHEYFRRLLCNMIGDDIESGLLPNDTAFFGNMVEDICYHNLKKFIKYKN
ncbi:MAG: glucuronate isomerase [Flavobacteriaceae bacterium]|jgi:glucuronate isomerase|nr:glucuronate isomerase [Flavobacteriaceae bacterium]MBT6127706.1 glucuronate isomerase [Flavobacteriaceae bacterium]MDG1027400.1 glucuronate isomerase [Flavobacteriaceae bacterium]MDG1942456.1 glucuronate isomerase [Flavobacteriaceae bacterium]